MDEIRSDSLKTVIAYEESSPASEAPYAKLQFDRHRYLVAGRTDHVQGTEPVYNLVVGLKDGWGK